MPIKHRKRTKPKKDGLWAMGARAIFAKHPDKNIKPFIPQKKKSKI